jgi:hypothetical protein
MNIYFLTGIPRAGNTILSSVFNQNPYAKISAHSVLPLLFNNILDVKNNNTFCNFPDFEGIDNIIRNIFKNYYAHYNCNTIIDRASWGFYLNLLEYMPVNNKFIILHRPLLEVLASFVRVEKPTNVIKYCDDLLLKETILSKALTSTQNIIDNKKEYLLITYDDLVNNICECIQKICKFIDIDYLEPDLNNIQQFKINDIGYDDSVLSGNFHTIKTDNIEKNLIEVEKILPKEIINKYKNFDINFN